MLKSLLIGFFTIILFIKGFGQTNWLLVKPEKGMGAYGLLRKYQLLDQAGHLDAFYRINKLNKGASLEKDKSYYLPVEVYNFDGRSIRTTMKIEDYSKAKDIQIYNEAMVSAGLKQKNYQSDRKLWVPYVYQDILPSESNARISRKENIAPGSSRELVADHRIETDDQELETLKPDKEKPVLRRVSNKTLTVGLFGEAHSSVPVESDELANQVFYIVPGHGGPDPGTVFKENDFTFCEDEYAYDVSLRLARNLLTKGATVYLIVQDKNDGIRDERYLSCDEDEVCIGDHEIPVSQIKRLRQGMIKTNTLYFQNQMEGIQKQWMISIHIDSQPEENRQDVFFYYQSESKASKKKAKELRNLFALKYKKFQGRDYSGSISARPLYVMRTSQADPIFIELANIRNAHDRERIASPRNRQLLADWILEGFIDQ
ncbi:MAG: N-acetylmuramoyl-L-alanine amidase [Saprospiraceae bacterium]